MLKYKKAAKKEKVVEAGAVLCGGHSINDRDVKYGLSVNGVVHPDRIYKNNGGQAGDVLVLAGSIPSTLPENIYEWILMCLKDKDVKVVVDATKDLLLNVLKYHPFLIKPNNHELGEMFQTTLTTEEEIIAHAKKLQERGARNVLVSMAKDGAILVTEDGEIYKKQPHNGTVVNSVGAGDSMVAGFLAGYLNTGSYERALELGTAAGSATAFQSWLASREDIVKLLDRPYSEYQI